MGVGGDAATIHPRGSPRPRCTYLPRSCHGSSPPDRIISQGVSLPMILHHQPVTLELGKLAYDCRARYAHQVSQLVCAQRLAFSLADHHAHQDQNISGTRTKPAFTQECP
ncbi:hypothetical protein X899_2464 [Burkholderia pseudomallei TSV 25]|nr:hypothetical protein X988_2095 [Burkholderia pseudomallei TSV 48]KGC28018.1 hypothetical protein DO64_2845 [Burkholderia pseudomallei]KGD37168.1 hypothetical protein DP44_1453 [Burkholderia pseudomallei]KGV75475.1 hypothetical protein X890_924 [Burkholderia pseudomallei MSHR4299]KGW05618.1 hypothetical protein X899_2464 [Burkholderia pseudomallei TSV 25]